VTKENYEISTRIWEEILKKCQPKKKKRERERRKKKKYNIRSKVLQEQRREK
jgi:hypothetical protein